MSALQKLQPQLFMQAKELMELGSVEATSTTIPLSRARQKNEYRGLSHVAKANKQTKLVDIKRSENTVPHDENMFGTDEHTNPGETLPESIKRQGIVNPVVLTPNRSNTKWIIQNGQHRIVAAHDINPEMFIPTSYEW